MPLKLFKRKGSENYHYRGSAGGQRFRGSTGTPDKTTAQRLVAEKEDRAWKRRLDGPASVTTFANAANLYRDARKPTRFLDKIEDHWKNTPIKAITKGGIIQSAIKLYPNCGGATWNRQVIVPTCAIINFAAKSDLCPTIKVDRFPVERKEKAPATWTWVEAFSSASSPHLGALAIFMFLTGARISEALSLTWANVDLMSARALIRQTKIGAERLSHLPPVLVAALANIGERSKFNSKPNNGRVFGYTSRDTARPMWNKVIRKAKIKPLSFHSCRHGFATSMLQAGVDPVTVAKLGGWKSTAHLFATYGHANEDDTLADLIVGGIERSAVRNTRKVLTK